MGKSQIASRGPRLCLLGDRAVVPAVSKLCLVGDRVVVPAVSRLCLLGDRVVVPAVSKNDSIIIKVGLITAARIMLRHWKVPRTHGLKEWTEEIIKITSYEYMLGRVNGESKMKETWDDFWIYVNLK